MARMEATRERNAVKNMVLRAGLVNSFACHSFFLHFLFQFLIKNIKNIEIKRNNFKYGKFYPRLLHVICTRNHFNDYPYQHTAPAQFKKNRHFNNDLMACNWLTIEIKSSNRVSLI